MGTEINNKHALVTGAGLGMVSHTAFDPDRIADTCWSLHGQPADQWTAETVVEGQHS